MFNHYLLPPPQDFFLEGSSVCKNSSYYEQKKDNCLPLTKIQQQEVLYSKDIKKYYHTLNFSLVAVLKVWSLSS